MLVMQNRKPRVATLAACGAALTIGIFVYGWNSVRMGAPAGAATQAPAPFSMPVPVATVVRKTLPIYLEYAARAESISSISLQARAPGYIASQAAPDGADVKAGQLLYQIDPRDLQAALDQATAQAQRDAASLDYAKGNFSRGQSLVGNGFVTKDAYEQRRSSLGQAQAALVADQAAIRTAQLNLSYTQIRAPFSGRLGRNQAPIGALMSVAGAALNTLVQLDPIYVTFNPSETELAQIEQARAAGPITLDVSTSGQPTRHYAGKLTFLDNAIDRSTGTITARGTVENPDFSLLPGEYVEVRLHLRDEPDALMVPQIAIGAGQLGQYVYVVGDKGTADQHLVKLGPADGSLVSVIAGVAPGDRIITGNLQKIGPGTPVKPLPAPAG
jgi:multidrug efflux system membrane fusion protein